MFTEIRLHQRILVWFAAIAFAGLCATGLVLADGPIGAGSLPGGAFVNDSDPGSGEQWGRLGGRTIQYTINDPANFTMLTWGAVGVSAVSLAFDGAVNAPTETLSLTSNSGGVAQWTGSAVLPLATGPALQLETRFTLTVTDGSGAAVPLSSDPSGNQPGLDVLAAGGQFTAHLLFEANHPGSPGIPAGWTPALDLFDALETDPGTPPGTGGPVLTGFNNGFFFEVLQGLSLEDHDNNLITQTEMIKDSLAFLTTDAINRLQMLAQEHGEIHNWVNANHQEALAALQLLQQLVQALPDLSGVATSEDVQRVSDDVRQAQEDLQNILLILFGILPCPDGADGCPPGETLQLFATPESVEQVREDVQSLLTKVMDIQTTLEESARMPEIEVQVTRVGKESHGRSHRKIVRFLMTTTINGKLADVSIVRALAISVWKRGPAVPQDVTVYTVPVSLGPGLVDVRVELPHGVGKAQAYQFDVFFDDGEVVAQGSALVPTGDGGRDH